MDDEADVLSPMEYLGGHKLMNYLPRNISFSSSPALQWIVLPIAEC